MLTQNVFSFNFMYYIMPVKNSNINIKIKRGKWIDNFKYINFFGKIGKVNSYIFICHSNNQRTI